MVIFINFPDSYWHFQRLGVRCVFGGGGGGGNLVANKRCWKSNIKVNLNLPMLSWLQKYSYSFVKEVFHLSSKLSKIIGSGGGGGGVTLLLYRFYSQYSINKIAKKFVVYLEFVILF